MIVTTNLPFSEWTTMFPNARLCKAMLDRLTDLNEYDRKLFRKAHGNVGPFPSRINEA